MKSIILLAAASLLFQNAWAGVHGGNGPDQEGYSVPLRLERGVEVEALESAQETCTKEVLMEYVSLREGKASAKKIECGSSAYFDSDFKLEKTGKRALASYCEKEGSKVSYILERGLFRDRIALRIKDDKRSTLYFIKQLNKKSTEDRYFYLGLPYFTYNESHPDAVYDIDGVLNKGKAMASNIQISHIAKSDFRLVNNATEGPSGYWVRPQEFKSCLERELFNNLNNAQVTQAR